MNTQRYPMEQYICYRSFRPQLDQTRDFAAMGIPLRCFFAANTINHGGSPYCDYPVIWKGFKNYDFAAFDAQVEDFLRVSPDAEFLCMIDLNTPYWATHKFWLDSFTDVSHAASDPQWIEKTREWMLDFIDYAEQKYGSRIKAYILSGGGTSEWYEYDRGRTSANKNAAWRKWCAEQGRKFGDSVPDQEKIHHAAFDDLLYDPVTEADKIAYWRFHNRVIADALLGFGDAARRKIPADKQIGAFFGYYYVSDSKHASFGHLDYERVFAAPYFDFFIAPGRYSERAIGGGSGSQLVHGTARRYGKRLMHEIDFGPHTQTRWGAGIWKTAADDMAGNTREAAFAIANGCNYWWFDMWGGENSFYEDPELRKRIAKLAEITRSFNGALPRPADEVLLIADPDAIYYVNERNPRQVQFGQYFCNALAKTGIPYNLITLSDLADYDMSRVRVVVYPAAHRMTAEKHKLLQDKVFSAGRTVIWNYAPGIIVNNVITPDNVKKYAGVAYKTPGISTTAMGDWTAVYCPEYEQFTVEKLREIIINAGVKPWVSVPTPVFANDRFVAVHTRDGGDLTLHLPRPAAKVTDLLSGEVIAQNTDTFTTRFAAPDTRLFGVE